MCLHTKLLQEHGAAANKNTQALVTNNFSHKTLKNSKFIQNWVGVLAAYKLYSAIWLGQLAERTRKHLGILDVARTVFQQWEISSHVVPGLYLKMSISR